MPPAKKPKPVVVPVATEPAMRCPWCDHMSDEDPGHIVTAGCIVQCAHIDILLGDTGRVVPPPVVGEAH